MKKQLIDLQVRVVEALNADHVLIRLTSHEPLPQTTPGQFVEVKVENSPNTFLRRPVSINYIDKANNEMWLLVHLVGDGTRALARLQKGATLNCIMPLGNGFTLPEQPGGNYLLVGGGVGAAPLLYYGTALREMGCNPVFLIGARTSQALLQIEMFEKTGTTFITTEDGSRGEKGYVTSHTALYANKFDRIAACGPKPMMQAVANYARQNGTECEVSLENLMACGIGACLCCIENTTQGNVRTCLEGPVFNIKQLKWHDLQSK